MSERPPSIVPIAVLHFVFGGMGILCGLCSGMQLAGGMSPTPTGPQTAEMKQMQEEMEKAVIESVAGSKAVQIGTMVIDLAISIIMIVSGIGLLQLRSWGRMLSILYAILGISLKIFEVVYAFAVPRPTIDKFLETQTVSAPGQQFIFTILKEGAIVPPIIQLVCMIYPIVVLIIMFRPSVVAAFRQGNLETPENKSSDEEP